MSNRVKPGARARASEPVVDHGAAPWRADVEVLDAADPDAPNRTVRRAQIVPGYERWRRAGHITDAQWEAADRYGKWTEAAEGAKHRASGMICRVAPWARSHATFLQSAAILGIEDVDHALGPDRVVMMKLIAIQRYSARQIAQAKGWRGGSGEARAMQAARDALDVAARHWGMED